MVSNPRHCDCSGWPSYHLHKGISSSDQHDVEIGEDERLEKMLMSSIPCSCEQRSASTTASPSTADCDAKPASSAAVTPTERLEQELKEARVFLESSCLMKEDEQSLVEVPSKGDVQEDDDNISLFVAKAKDQILEMEKARDELMQSSIRAEEYLAGLAGLINGEKDEKDGVKVNDSHQMLMTVTATMEQEDRGEEANDNPSTATSMDMKLLLAGISDLRRDLTEAREEISKLRHAVVSSAKGDQHFFTQTQTHRRVHSYPQAAATHTSTTAANTTSIPTEVEFYVDAGSASRASPSMVPHQMRISHGFVENNWLEQHDDECLVGGRPCLLGGLANMIKGRSGVGTRGDLLG